MILGFLQAGIMSDIKSIREYTKSYGSYLKRQLDGFAFSIDAQANKIEDNDEKDAFYEFHSDTYWELKDFLPDAQRKSALVMAYSLLEHNLASLCSVFNRRLGLKLSLNEIKGRGIIDTARIYLAKVVGLDFPDSHSSWTEIKKIQRIRNAIVHNDSKIKPEKTDLVSYISNTGGLELDSTNRVKLGDSYVSHALDTIESFYEILFERITKVDVPVGGT